MKIPETTLMMALVAFLAFPENVHAVSGIPNNDSTIVDNNNNRQSDWKPEASTIAKPSTPVTSLHEGNCDGFACGEDEFCSRQWRICRACEDIKGRCNNMTDIHLKYSACEQFCFRLQRDDAVRECVAQKNIYQRTANDLNQALAEKETKLRESHRNASVADEKLADQDALIEELGARVELKEKEVEACSQKRAACDGDKENLFNILVGVVIGLLALCLFLLCLTLYFWRKSAKTNPARDGQNGPQNSTEELLLQGGTQDVKVPVEEDRRIVYDQRDLIVPGGARDGHRPRDCGDTTPA